MERYKGNNRRSMSGYPDNSLQTNGNTGDYIQLIGSIASAIGDTIQAFGQGISIAEDEQQQLNQQLQLHIVET